MLRLALISSLFAACTHPSTSSLMETVETTELRWDHTPAGLAARCDDAHKSFIHELDSLAKVSDSDVSFETTARRLDIALSELGSNALPLTFLFNVSTDADVRKNAQNCAVATDKLVLDTFTRSDIYAALKKAAVTRDTLSGTEQILLDEMLLDFKNNGLELPEQQRNTLKALKAEIITLTSGFEAEINNWTEVLHFSKKELDGLPEDILQSLAKSKKAGKDYILTLKTPHYMPAMHYVKNPEVRRKLFTAFKSRGGKANKQRLTKVLETRAQIAHLLGYKNHAEMILSRRMAQTPEKVADFLQRLQGRLGERGTKEFHTLLTLKRAELKNPKIATVEPWDTFYYQTRLLEAKYKVDGNLIKEYFPVDHTVQQMFVVYQQLLGVRFEEIPDAPKWHESVKAYRIVNANDGSYIASFYTDLFPREGKYTHAAAFGFLPGYQKANGKFQAPTAAIVANLAVSGGDMPALMAHGDVGTLFHEFGHIMHMTLTRVRYGYLSGANVKLDFVEAPSQMFENWVWNTEMLTQMTSHFRTRAPLPTDLAAKLVASRFVNEGISQLQQLVYANMDFAYHTWDGKKPFDTTTIYHKIFKEILKQKPVLETHPESGFGHLVGGYDSGYYGYLWSKVYAEDMFTRFEHEGLLNPDTGKAYKQTVLEKGGSANPFALLHEFLGREPNEEAFLRQFTPSH